MAKISLNKLAEILVTTSPTRRRRILQDQKYPNTNIVARYRNAYPPIRDYLTKGRVEQSILGAVNDLRNQQGASEWVIDDCWNTADALEKFLDIAGSIPSSAEEVYSQGDQAPPKLSIAGVDISVRPDFLISFTKKGKKYTGALKFHFIKNPDSALTHAGAEYVSTLLHQWLDVHGPDGAVPAHSHCLCIDVFRGNIVPAPKSTTRRINDVTAMCEEIAARWPQL